MFLNPSSSSPVSQSLEKVQSDLHIETGVQPDSEQDFVITFFAIESTEYIIIAPSKGAHCLAYLMGLLALQRRISSAFMGS